MANYEQQPKSRVITDAEYGFGLPKINRGLIKDPMVSSAMNGHTVSFSPDDKTFRVLTKKHSVDKVESAEKIHRRKITVDGRNMVATDANFKQSLSAVSFSGRGRKRVNRL